jgi:phosphatidylglycerophosphatase A
VALLLVPAIAGNAPAAAHVVAGFFLFRAFDVAKPYPIQDIEKLPGGWGLLLDDVMAGVYANIGVRVLIFLVWWLTSGMGSPGVI